MKRNKRERATLRTYPKQLMNKQEFADEVTVSARTVETWQKRGILRPVKIGNIVRFDWEDSLEQLRKYRLDIVEQWEAKRIGGAA